MLRSRLALIIVALVGVLALLFVVLAVGLVAGLGSKGSPGPAPGETPSDPAATGNGVPSGPSSGELRILGADPPTMDPHLAGDVDSATYIVEIFSGLVTLDRDLKVVPDIAESWQTTDGVTWTFQLRPGVRFHNNKVVTAQDFKFSFERACDPRTASTTAHTYLGDIVGCTDKLNGVAREVRGVQVVDDATLRLVIDAPKVYFIEKLTYPTAFVLDEANVRSGSAWTLRPNGTGPFKLQEWRPGERLILQRNDAYYRGPAKLERVRFILSGGSSITMYENNEIDVSGVGLTDIDRALDPANPLNRELINAPELSVGYIGFNTTKPPFDDLKVRQAFNYAVDKRKIVSVVLKDLVEPAAGILPPGLPGYSKDIKGLEFDAARAKQLLAESKYGSAQGLGRVVITIPGTGTALPPTSEAIIQQWKDNLGVTVEIQQVEFATFLQDLNRGIFQAFEIGWVADYPDPQNFLDLLFHSGSLENRSYFSDPEVDRILDQARVEKNETARLALYRQAEQLIVDKAPWLPLWHGRGYILVKPYVRGWYIAPLVVPFFKDISIEK
ncbi:MAG: peptide ABC transporter substrate-binding protein [Chloroflexi bacterium]|nr:peptide ABC transporter substrate-binding protein [Chloroflexota bacterium]